MTAITNADDGRRFAGKIALVTGASRGIGQAVARALGRQGAHVVAVARTVGGLEALDDAIRKDGGPAATLVPLDLTDGAAIDRIGAALFERFGRLDILVGNAGILGTLSPVGHLDPSTFERVFAINVTANWRLIRSLDPLLRRSPAGRALFVTSGITRHAAPYWAAYTASKAALEALALGWAAETVDTTLRVNLINPGPTRTRLRAEAFPGEKPETLSTPEAIAEAFLPALHDSCTQHGAWIAADECLAKRGVAVN